MNDWTLPALVNIGGAGRLRCHALKPLLRSLIVFGSVSRSFNRVHRSWRQQSLIACAPGCLHCRICAVISFLCLHLGQATNIHLPHLCIIVPVAQKSVVNLVVHHHCLIVIAITTICTTVQSINWMSILLNLVLLAQ